MYSGAATLITEATTVNSLHMHSVVVGALTSLLLGVSPAMAQKAALQLATPIERALAPDESAHVYTVTAQASQMMVITAEQHGIDVVVEVLDPSGKQLASVDSAREANGLSGAETARVAALTPGEYKVRIVPFKREDAKPAKYTIRLSELRALTASERLDAQSERELIELERRWEEARDKLDIPTLSSILKDDAFALGPTASATRTREEIVAAWHAEAARRTKSGAVRDHTLSEHAIKVAGSVAVSTARYLLTNTVPGQAPTKVSGQFVHIWAKTDNGWKLAADYGFPFGRVPREQPDSMSVESSLLSAYTGTYRQECCNNTITISLNGGTLEAQWQSPSGLSPKAALMPLREATFLAPGEEEITFVRSAAGPAVELVIVSDGPARRAFRVK